MKTITNTIPPAFALFALAWFAVSSTTSASPSQTNTKLGTQAFQANTTGVNDTALGYQALKSNTMGSGNTATGSQALLANTIGNNNTATGFDALVSNIYGQSNTANGYQALYSNLGSSTDSTLGVFNTATGSQALFSNTIGFEGTAVGYQALYNNVGSTTPDPTTGYLPGTQNTAVGSQALYSNTYGFRNIAVGTDALFSNVNGFINTAVGDDALYSNVDGIRNVAFGNATLYHSTHGSYNTAIGHSALIQNISGNGNTALGRLALYSNTTIGGTSGHDNTAAGNVALFSNTTGSFNIALGSAAGDNLDVGGGNIDIGNEGVAGESNTIRIGTTVGGGLPVQTATFIAGITGTAVVGNAVVVDGNGQLGTVASAGRFKKDIKPMDKTSEAILALKPVTFQYKSDGKGTPQFGLIAEDVAKVNQDLVVRDRNGEIYSVRYEAVNAMLLNEFLKEHRKVEELEATVAQQHKDFEAAVAELKGQIQKVSAQLEVSRPAPQVVENKE
jgi:hypothetical protein